MDGGRAGGRLRTALAAALAAVCLWLLAAPRTADAARDNLYFVAVDEVVLPLDDSSMPFWYASHLYISGAMFDSTSRRTLGVVRVQNLDRGLMVFTNGIETLTFREEEGYGEDEEGKTYYPGIVLRDGEYFAPASVLSTVFGFTYSVTEVEHGSLVWLRDREFRLNDKAFAAAAAPQLRKCYEEYLRTHPEAASTDGGRTTDAGKGTTTAGTGGGGRTTTSARTTASAGTTSPGRTTTAAGTTTAGRTAFAPRWSAPSPILWCWASCWC